MYQNKKALLIGGGGTLGRYTAQELLDKGCQVDILCMNEPNMCHPNLQIIRGKVDYAYLEAFLADKKYDGIVNFLHFEDIEAYKPLHKLLTDHTDQLIALSSYRVYNETNAPITEETPQLLHTSKDSEFLKDKTYYALVKSVLEDYIREESGTTNWTIVRPVISFSERRLDLVTRSGKRVVLAAQAGEPFELPLAAKDLIAGLDWSGNSGKLIANLLFKEYALGQAYTISSAPNLTWGQVADIYSELLGVQIKWIGTEEYLVKYCDEPYGLIYDRLFDRPIDNSKVLAATGLRKEDFTSIRDGVIIELRKLGIQV